MRTAKLLSDFEREVMAHYSPSPRNTREGMRYALLHVMRVCGDLTLDAIGFAEIERFKRVRLAEGRLPNTVTTTCAVSRRR